MTTIGKRTLKQAIVGGVSVAIFFAAIYFTLHILEPQDRLPSQAIKHLLAKGPGPGRAQVRQR
jgi:hypothetical protein